MKTKLTFFITIAFLVFSLGTEAQVKNPKKRSSKISLH